MSFLAIIFVITTVLQANKGFANSIAVCCFDQNLGKMWPFGWKGPSGFSPRSTAEQVTQGIDATGLTAIVTGASSGIGTETSRVLALRGAHVVMAVRNVDSGKKVKEEILKEIPNAKIDVMQLDLSSIESVRKFVSEFISLGLPLNLLINNAGIMAAPFMLSQDNIEMQFATNHVELWTLKRFYNLAGHFLLTELLLDTMKKSASESNLEGRIVIVSSDAHHFTYRGGIRFDKINDESGYNSIQAYGQSKLANILHANELTRRLKEEGVDITVNSLHPGSIMTNLLRFHSVINILNITAWCDFIIRISRMWFFGRKGPSGFSASSTAEEVTQGIDGTGLTAIVTGASSGIGAETTRVLALRGVHVIMAVRNLDAGRKGKEAMLKEIPKAKIDVMELDLSSMASVRNFAHEYTSLGLPLNILINNAGVLSSPSKLSQDNIELLFATNHLGHFLLTNIFLEIMRNTAQKSKREGRIINVSSVGHRIVSREGICFDKIYKEASWFSYGQSKLANILHANELARRLKVEMYGFYNSEKHIARIYLNRVPYVRKLEKDDEIVGAATTCYIALHQQVKGMSGNYFMDSNIAEPSSQAKDAELAKKLWDFSLSITDKK
ncbi:hypothetical protein SADUNF_Sadunf01G0081000 [Salix dunnii]|uniref:Uncharacterized protein n=1 Tax=Salix dunnii TaxID=1413687 RepID=A0A835NB46_9ROSI|nr:hypothetical protein SADUNF_Sadunf01G0081000 [Salix dunnii]